MGEFDLDEHSVRTQNLEATVATTKIDDRAKRIEELQRIKKEQYEALQRAESAAKKNSAYQGSISKDWDAAIQGLVEIQNGQEMSGLRKALYAVLEKFGINMYERDCLKNLSIAKRLADKIKKELDGLDRKLNQNYGDKGFAVALREQREVGTYTANALIRSKQLLEGYNQQIQAKLQEVQEVQEKSRGNGADYTTDLQYLHQQLADLRKEREGVGEDVRKLSNSLHLYDVKIETKQALVTTIHSVYTKGLEAYTDLQASIEIAQELVKNGDIVKGGIAQTVIDLETGIKHIGDLVKLEGVLGRTLVDGTRQLGERAADIRILTRDKQYLDDLTVLNSQDQQEAVSTTDHLIAKYATMHYK